MSVAVDVASAQLPAAGELTLDHLAYFVPRIDAAGEAIEPLGFTLTPFSAQSHRLVPGGPLEPAGTGNRCIMLERGYLEFLAPTGDTRVANQLRVAMERYTGVHSIVFGTAAPEADHARLEQAGFAPLPPVALQREIATDREVRTARFTVVRVPPGAMAEGRIQYCRHHTPELLWQQRWMTHANGATALSGVVLCVGNPADAAQRYARFTGARAQPMGASWRIDTARGWLSIMDPDALARAFELTPPCLPWIGACVLETRDIGAAKACLRAAGAPTRELAGGSLLARMPADVGGALIFATPGSDPSETALTSQR